MIGLNVLGGAMGLALSDTVSIVAQRLTNRAAANGQHVSLTAAESEAMISAAHEARRLRSEAREAEDDRQRYLLATARSLTKRNDWSPHELIAFGRIRFENTMRTSDGNRRAAANAHVWYAAAEPTQAQRDWAAGGVEFFAAYFETPTNRVPAVKFIRELSGAEAYDVLATPAADALMASRERISGCVQRHEPETIYLNAAIAAGGPEFKSVLAHEYLHTEQYRTQPGMSDETAEGEAYVFAANYLAGRVKIAPTNGAPTPAAAGGREYVPNLTSGGRPMYRDAAGELRIDFTPTRMRDFG